VFGKVDGIYLAFDFSGWAIDIDRLHGDEHCRVLGSVLRAVPNFTSSNSQLLCKGTKHDRATSLQLESKQI
jgi:hypothetical protein